MITTGKLFTTGQLKEMMYDCTMCPRECHANRMLLKKGFCGETDKVRVARSALHFWEEPCVSGDCGSGAVFFSGCSVGCVFCQNYQIAREDVGMEVSISQLSELFCELMTQGAVNINLVTPSHFVPQIIRALQDAKSRGMTLPIVYNTSAYEKVETLRLLEGLVDVYLPDFKYISSDRAMRYSRAADYPEIAKAAIAEMVRQTGTLALEDGLLKRGVIVRHLCMPGGVKEAKMIIKYLYETYHDSVFVSIMSQYTPISTNLLEYPEINRQLSKREYARVVQYAMDIGMENAFIQENGVDIESFIPNWNMKDR